MDSANFINFIKNPGSLHQLSYQELNSLIEAYPYCQNLHFMVMMKAKVEQHKDFEKKLGLAATYCADRKFLFQQIQDPVRPDSTSDSYYGASEMSPEVNEPVEEVVRSRTALVPPSFVTADDEDEDSEIPEEITHTKDETLAPEYISDQNLDPDIKIIEDESGSQLIIKKADMPMHPEDEKRKVVYLEDLFEEKEKIKEIPAISQDEPVDDGIPVESEAPPVPPLPEEIDEPELSLEDDDIFAVESDAVSDHDMGIPISDADMQTDQSELQEQPQENMEDASTLSPGLDIVKEEELLSENEFIAIPDHIIDDIPFEITNVVESPIEDYEDADEVDFIQEEAFSEEGNDKISEQSTGISVVDKKNRMALEEEEENNEIPEDKFDEEDDKEEIEQDVQSEEDLEELIPLPKIAFKSWPSKFQPVISKTEEITPIEEAEELQVSESESEENNEAEVVESSKNLDIFIEEEKEKEEERSINLTEVIKEHKSKKKKKKLAKAKKKKKAKKEKAKLKEIKNIEEEAAPKSKKKKKKKDKKKKKENTKQLALKSLTLKDDIISETLAELLVDQGSNKKAIKMYKKLSLIFPEKSAFFASQIKKLKK